MNATQDHGSGRHATTFALQATAHVVSGKLGARIKWLGDTPNISAPVGTHLYALVATAPVEPNSPAPEDDGLPALPTPQVLGTDASGQPILGFSTEQVVSIRRDALEHERRNRVRLMKLPPAMRAALDEASCSNGSKSNSSTSNPIDDRSHHPSISTDRTFVDLWHACFVARPGAEGAPMRALIACVDHWGAVQRDVGRAQYAAEVKQFWTSPDENKQQTIPSHLQECVDAVALEHRYQDAIGTVRCVHCEASLSDGSSHLPDCVVLKAVKLRCN